MSKKDKKKSRSSHEAKRAKPSSERAAVASGHAHGHTHAHPHEHDHAHVHAHPHGHAHPHEHGHAHDHAHPHDHDHVHAHPHEHSPRRLKGSGFHVHAGERGEPGSEPAPHPHGPLPEHGHGHEHEHEGAPRLPLLSEGEGRGLVLYFDAFAGLAGDMILAALLDLGVPLLVVERALAALPLEGFHLHRGHAHKNAIVATSFEVHLEAPQPKRDYATIDAMLREAPLEPAVRDLARRIFRTLGESEALVHRMPLESVHFHEVGAVDAIVDIVGAAAALSFLGAELVCSPLPMGRGFVRADHGYLPLPAPAVVHCLRGLPTYGVDLEAELVTPTGAAIVATAATRFSGWPSLAPLRVGHGAGARDLPDRPNLLRAVLGRPTESRSIGEATHLLVEANVDDLTGELAGHAIAQLLDAGALDAWASPVTMKKGRPGLVLSALVERARLEAVEGALLRETTTIGLRRQAVGRTERPRRTVTVRTRFGELRVKLSEGGFGAPQIKPEFDDCVALAEAAGVPVREVLRAAFEAAWRDVDPQD